MLRTRQTNTNIRQASLNSKLENLSKCYKNFVKGLQLLGIYRQLPYFSIEVICPQTQRYTAAFLAPTWSKSLQMYIKKIKKYFQRYYVLRNWDIVAHPSIFFIIIKSSILLARLHCRCRAAQCWMTATIRYIYLSQQYFKHMEATTGLANSSVLGIKLSKLL